ncbi:hypothetical protein [Synechococcus sp. CCY 9618]|uniref:hypothetical protein n=1 Tax=Synechococcus sp. CCY 9618 TaxID=2815602 RepID=UPI001C21B2C9|nr:hypothetical protein [Synechococcus sp. CCY 9618]
MDVQHPADDAPLSPEQQRLLEQFRERVDARISSHGLTSADVAELVKELRGHPRMSRQMMAQLSQEMERLLPGQRFSFDWD